MDDTPSQGAIAEPQPAGVRALDLAVWQPGWRRVAVVGASKNAGKTTALNALCAAVAQRGERAGIVSIGVDGEAFDAWLDIPKPRVRVEKGTLVITAEACVAASGGLLRTVGSAGFGSALGPTVLAEARGPGGVQLCGVPHRQHLVTAVAALQAAGASRILVDGAYHRQAAAHADVADAIVVSVGAVLGEDAREAAHRAAVTLAALATPAGGVETASGVLDVEGALADHWLDRHLGHGVRVLRVEGPSRVLLSETGRARLLAAGIAITARRPLPVVAVTSNPRRPGGTDDDGAVLQAEVAAVLVRLGIEAPVIDVVRGTVVQGLGATVKRRNA